MLLHSPPATAAACAARQCTMTSVLGSQAAAGAVLRRRAVHTAAASAEQTAERMRATRSLLNAYVTPFDAATMQAVSAVTAAPATAAAPSAASSSAAAAAASASAAATASSAPLFVSLKDNFCLAGHRTTAASRMLSSFVPHYDSTVAARLKARGALITGKTNMDEFGMGSFSANSHFSRVVNPWSFRGCRSAADVASVLSDDSRLLSAGGSSGGAAAALSAGTCGASIGSDTGGSIRLPASYCGLLGLKPTYGRVSRFGLISYASSLDTPSIMAKDTATLRDIMSQSRANEHSASGAEARAMGNRQRGR